MTNRSVNTEVSNALKLVRVHKLSMRPKTDNKKKHRGDSFQIDDLVDSIRSAQPANRTGHIANVEQSNHKSASHKLASQDLPIVPLVQSKGQEPKRMRSGFFRRFFSSSNNDLTALAAQESGEKNTPYPANARLFQNAFPSSRSSSALVKDKYERNNIQNPNEVVPPEEVPGLQSLPTTASDKMYVNPSKNESEAPALQHYERKLSAAPSQATVTRTRSTSLLKNERDPFLWSTMRHKSHTSENSDGHSGDWSHVYPSYLHDPINLSQGMEVGSSDRSAVQTTSPPITEETARHSSALDRPLANSDTPITPAVNASSTNEVRYETSVIDDATLHAVKASAMYESQDLSMSPENYAVYLGTEGHEAVRKTFLELFDFFDMSVLQALRKLCSKLYIKGETQVIDRILESFSQRWRDCNQANEFLTKDVVHIIAYALITLNTDLYIANTQTDQKMRRSAFVQNTLHAINVMVTMPDTEQNLLLVQGIKYTEEDPVALSEGTTIRYVPKSASSNTILQDGSPLDTGIQSRLVTYDSPTEPAASRLTSLEQSRGRDEYLKVQLQDMYLSIRNEQIRQPRLKMGTRHNTSETGYSVRSAQAGSPSIPSSTRSRSFVMYGDASANTSVTSVDLPTDHNSLPATGSHESKQGKSANALFGPYSGSRLSISSRTSRSAVGASTITPQSRGIGFAGSLSNIIIREETNIPLNDTQDVAQAIDDAVEDDLMLSGAPFAKEGRLHYKMQSPSFNRRSRYKQWSSELFAVLERGQIRLFDFNAKVSKMNKSTFGGGDWTQSAKMVQDISLIQCVAYHQAQKSQATDRPHMWTLRTPNGDLHYFQVGTEELIQEWVSTANYWAARVTKEPLLGAVDNAEYGWSQAILQPAGHRRASIAPSIAASVMGDDNAAARAGNKANIRDWQPDPSPSLTSSMNQRAQLASFTKFVKNIESELERHRALRANILSAYSPRHPNLLRAMTNFDRKATHLQDTLDKYGIYIEALRAGISLSETIEASKQNENLDALTRLSSVS